MYLMYVDESGDTGLSLKSPTRYFILSALVFHELRWNEMYDRQIQFRRWLKSQHGIALNEEIHATELMSARGIFKNIRPHARLNIMKNCLDWIGNQPDLSILTVAIDKRATTGDVFDQSWERLIAEFETLVRNKKIPGPSNADERGIILPDNTNGKKLTAILWKMRGFNRNSANATQIKPITIVEDPFMKDSASSFFLQMVDVVAFFARQYFEPNSLIKNQGGGNYYGRLAAVINQDVKSQHPLKIIIL
jgi:hypothetical protein